MSLDVAAQPSLFAPLLCGVVLLSIRDEAMRAGVVLGMLPILLSAGPRVKLFKDLAAGLAAVSAFGVILRSLLVTVAVLHAPLFSESSRLPLEQARGQAKALGA